MDITLTTLVKYEWFVPDDFILAAWRKTEEAYAVSEAARIALMTKFGAEKMCHKGPWISGLMFAKEPSVGWREVARNGREIYYMPKRSKKVDKAVYDEIAAVSYVGMWHFADQFGGSQVTQDHGSNGFLITRGATIQKICGAEMFGLPRDVDFDKFENVPEGLVPVGLTTIIGWWEAEKTVSQAAVVAA
jgi:hypothetical protein